MGLFDWFRKKDTVTVSMPVTPPTSCEPEYGDNFGKCGDAAHWRYDITNNSFIISGEGSIDKFENVNDYLVRTMHDPHGLGPWCNEPDFIHSSIVEKVIEITIPEGITSIDCIAFFWFRNLKTLILPNSLAHISDAALLPAEQITFYVRKGSYADSALDSMRYRKSYYGN